VERPGMAPQIIPRAAPVEQINMRKGSKAMEKENMGSLSMLTQICNQPVEHGIPWHKDHKY
jgi:hypothetical protein